MNKYKCFYSGKTCEVEATTSLAARDLAAAHFKPHKSKLHMISVLLLKTIHNPAILGA